MEEKEQELAQQKKVSKTKQVESEEMPHKGKKAEFFYFRRDEDGVPVLTQEQKNFIYLHYPTHADPEDMAITLLWLEEFAKEYEELDA
jgi:hypothetical protein